MFKRPRHRLPEFHTALTTIGGVLKQDRAWRGFATGLLALNLGLILLPVVLLLLEAAGVITPLSRAWAQIGAEDSFAEAVNHGQIALTMILLIGLGCQGRASVYFALAGLFAFILIDDAFQYHERMGALILDIAGFSRGASFYPLPLGEFLAWSVAGLVILPPVLRQIRRATGPARGAALVCATCFIELVLCAVLIHWVNGIFASRLLVVLEDGGEMLAMAAAAISMGALLRAGAARRPVNRAGSCRPRRRARRASRAHASQPA